MQWREESEKFDLVSRNTLNCILMFRESNTKALFIEIQVPLEWANRYKFYRAGAA